MSFDENAKLIKTINLWSSWTRGDEITFSWVKSHSSFHLIIEIAKNYQRIYGLERSIATNLHPFDSLPFSTGSRW